MLYKGKKASPLRILLIYRPLYFFPRHPSQHGMQCVKYVEPMKFFNRIAKISKQHVVYKVWVHCDKYIKSGTSLVHLNSNNSIRSALGRAVNI